MTPLPDSILKQIASEMRTDRNGAVIDMASELLDLRAKRAVLVAENSILQEHLDAAEKVVEAARYYKGCHKTLHIALEAYDKVKNEAT